MQKLIFRNSFDRKKIENTVKILQKDGILIHPTENLYGFGAEINALNAINKISQLKKRPSNKGYIVLIGERTQLDLLVTDVNRNEETMMEKFWPGPLTIIFNAKKIFFNHPISMNGTIAVRLVGNPITRKIIKKCHSPIISTSINVSGEEIINDEEKIFDEYSNKVDGIVIDKMHEFTDRPSTIVRMINNEINILRQGAVSKKSILR